MGVAIVTGAAGLVGSEAVRFLAEKGMDVVGIDNGMRAQFFGPEASTIWMRNELSRKIPSYAHHDVDIRDQQSVFSIFARYGTDVELVIHTAAQPSHDWATTHPFIDFSVNANGTHVLLEATRVHSRDAVFIFTSTNKVYGDRPNCLPLIEKETRWEISPDHEYANGIPEDMPVDRSLHSLFGVSKVAADILVQEYGRYFGMKTVCFRGGCLTGPRHSGAELHGFLSYLMRCATTRTRYRVLGYKGKQVRDNIHSFDLIRAFDEFFKAPRCGEVYNIGGGRFSHCSVMEAIAVCEDITHRKMNWEYIPNSRIGDHIWYVSDLTRFRTHYPAWQLQYDVPAILREIYDENVDRWTSAVGAAIA